MRRPFVVIPLRPYLAGLLDALSEFGRGNKPIKTPALSGSRKTSAPNTGKIAATVAIVAMCACVTVGCVAAVAESLSFRLITTSPFGHSVVWNLWKP